MKFYFRSQVHYTLRDFIRPRLYLERSPSVLRILRLKLIARRWSESGTLSVCLTERGERVLNALNNFVPSRYHCRRCRERIECLTWTIPEEFKTQCKRKLKVIDL